MSEKKVRISSLETSYRLPKDKFAGRGTGRQRIGASPEPRVERKKRETESCCFTGVKKRHAFGTQVENSSQ